MKQAGVMLIVKDGLILSISRRNDKTKFGLPGGKCEEGELVKNAAIRETQEETDVSVKECLWIFTRDELRHAPDGQDFECHCFYATKWEGEPHNSEEGDVKWLTVEELTTTNGAFPDYNRRTIDAFKLTFPNVFLVGESCPGGCNNTGWQEGENEGFICDVCDRACICGSDSTRNKNCLVH